MGPVRLAFLPCAPTLRAQAGPWEKLQIGHPGVGVGGASGWSHSPVSRAVAFAVERFAPHPQFPSANQEVVGLGEKVLPEPNCL